MKRIGDILTRNKTRMTVEDGISYKQVTIRTNYKGVALRGEQDGSAIGTKEQFRVKAGQFILSRIDARNGAFGIIPGELEGAIVTNDFLAFDINENKVETEFFNVFLQSPIFLEACIKASRGNTNRKRVDGDFFLNYEVNLPSLSEQHQLIKRINKARAGIATAQHEITRQQSLLAKLKQAILQEAIQGKLTADWRAAHPDVESASRLMDRIAQKRARWIEIAKAKDNKEAAVIERKLNKLAKCPTPIPVAELPQTWRWATLIESNLLVVDCHNKTAPYANSGIPLIRTTNVRNGRLLLASTKFVTEQTYQRWSARCVPESGDLIFTREAPLGEVGLIPENVKLCLGQRTMLIRPIPDFVLPEYLLIAIQSPDFIERAARSKRGAMVGHLRVGDVERAFIPMPPSAEQKAIVEKVEALMSICRALEAEIEHARTHAAYLLQAALREAFSGKLAAQDANDKPAPPTAKVIPFPVKIPNISATDLQAGIIAMAYQRHEDAPKFLQHFHHVKAEKIVHLVEAHLGIDLERMPVKAAAGPNDYPHLKKVESRARKANWFDVRQEKNGGAHTYYKKSGFDALLDKAASALGERAAEVDALISLLLPMDTRQAEIVATLYAAWNNLLLLGRSPSDEEIVYEARENWHASKLEIERERFFKALEWMRKHGLVPSGRGRYVDAK